MKKIIFSIIFVLFLSTGSQSYANSGLTTLDLQATEFLTTMSAPYGGNLGFCDDIGDYLLFVFDPNNNKIYDNCGTDVGQNPPYPQSYGGQIAGEYKVVILHDPNFDYGYYPVNTFSDIEFYTTNGVSLLVVDTYPPAVGGLMGNADVQAQAEALATGAGSSLFAQLLIILAVGGGLLVTVLGVHFLIRHFRKMIHKK